MVLTAGMLGLPIRPAPGLAAPTRRGNQATPGRSLPVCSRIARSSNDRRVPTHSAAATLDLFAAGGMGIPSVRVWIRRWLRYRLAARFAFRSCRDRVENQDCSARLASRGG